MTEPKNNIDFAAIAANSDEVSTVARQKQRKKKQIIAVGVTAAVFLGFSGYILSSFMQKTDFVNDVPLTENISQWTPIKWQTEGIDKEGGVEFEANGVTWTPSEDGPFFLAEAPSGQCSLTMTRIGNGLGENDKESSNLYTEEFRKGSAEWISSDSVWLTTTEGSRAEFIKSHYVNQEDDYAYEYHRGTPENNGILMLVASCESLEDLETIFPDEGGAEIAGIALVDPATFSVF